MRFQRLLFPVASVFFTVAIFPILGNFFVEFARQKGLYDNPEAAMSGIIEAVSGWVGLPWYPYTVGGATGFLIGVFAEPLLRKIFSREPKSDDLRDAINGCFEIIEEFHRSDSEDFREFIAGRKDYLFVRPFLMEDERNLLENPRAVIGHWGGERHMDAYAGVLDKALNRIKNSERL